MLKSLAIGASLLCAVVGLSFLGLVSYLILEFIFLFDTLIYSDEFPSSFYLAKLPGLIIVALWLPLALSFTRFKHMRFKVYGITLGIFMILAAIYDYKVSRHEFAEHARKTFSEYFPEADQSKVEIEYFYSANWLDPTMEISFKAEPSDFELRLESWKSADPDIETQAYGYLGSSQPVKADRAWSKTFSSSTQGFGYPSILLREKDTDRYVFKRSFNQALDDSAAN